MIRVHLARLWRDRRLLLCVLAALLLAVIIANPQQGITLERTREMELSELLARFGLPPDTSREAFEAWYAGPVLSSYIGRTPSAVILAAIVGSYLVGSCLTRPVNGEIFAGRARVRIALSLCGATAMLAVVLSLLLTGLVLLVYCWELLEILGTAAVPRILPAMLWRLFFDVAVFCPVVLMAFITREMYFPLCSGALLAALTTILELLQAELWWFPAYAAQTVLLYAPTGIALLRLVLPSVILLMITPIFAVVRLTRCEMK